MRAFLTAVLVMVALSAASQQRGRNPRNARSGKTPPPAAAATPIPAKPRLVVGIVVDQMRYDLLTRYAAKYGPNGFQRLVRTGFSFEQMNYNYMPTYTGPGHASIYRGATPAVHGIIANEWYSRQQQREFYCSEDTLVQTLGANNASGQMSPRNLLGDNLSDRMAQQGGKVVGIALKDRGAILPAGHKPVGAYWWDRQTGNWVTSTYYHRQMPAWAARFNERRLADSLIAKPWATLLPLEQYTESTPDDFPGEDTPMADRKRTFPHQPARRKDGSYGDLPYTPWGNTLTTEMAKAAIEGEQLGRGTATDLLCISYSAPDYVGHAFGPNSVETEDTYLRLDQELAGFFAYLDQQFGWQNVVVFLTADHGVAALPEFAQKAGETGGRFSVRPYRQAVDSLLAAKYGPGSYILDFTNQQLYLNHTLLAQKQVALDDAIGLVADFTSRYPRVTSVLTRQQMLDGRGLEPYPVARGYHPDRSGDLSVQLEYGWFDNYSDRTTGTTHGTHYPYDTHVPFVISGWKVTPGRTGRNVFIPDIAVTLLHMLGLPALPDATGSVLPELSR